MRNREITMGNDEFILYIRKKPIACLKSNDQLGKEIWNWIDSKGAKIIQKDKPSLWGETASHTNELKLPKTAAQFKFDRSLLPELYDFLDEI